MKNGLLQFPVRNPDLFSPEINRQVLSTSEFNRLLYAAIRALPSVKDSGSREELKGALCDLLPRSSLLRRGQHNSRPASRSRLGTVQVKEFPPEYPKTLHLGDKTS